MIVKICKITCKYVKYIWVIFYNVLMVQWHRRFSFMAAIAKRKYKLRSFIESIGITIKKKGYGVPFSRFNPFFRFLHL